MKLAQVTSQDVLILLVFFQRLVSRAATITMCAVVIIMLSHPVSAQKTDSLKTALKNSERDTARVDVLTNLCTVYWNNDPDSALFYANNALSLARELKYLKGIGTALNYIGVVYFYQADYQHADEYIMKAVAFCKENNLKAPLAHALSNAGGSCFKQRRHESGMAGQLHSINGISAGGIAICRRDEPCDQEDQAINQYRYAVQRAGRYADVRRIFAALCR
jgi:tetratricopeptide (TPR) repeat protein